MNEKEFLSAYTAKAFSSPLLTVDAVLFTYHEHVLKVLLVKRSNHPEKDKWGLPGGFIDQNADKTIEDTVIRKLKEKTGVQPPYIDQLCTIGNSSRDKRGWSVTACFFSLVAHQDCTAGIDSVTDAKWIDVKNVAALKLAFDHEDIIHIARERIRQKALYSIVPAYALPELFTLPELQSLHEVLVGKEIQKKSFRRRIEQANLLEDSGKMHAGGKRPAVLYRMKKTAGRHTFIRNLED